jgi:hypothetical protein
MLRHGMSSICSFLSSSSSSSKKKTVHHCDYTLMMMMTVMMMGDWNSRRENVLNWHFCRVLSQVFFCSSFLE